MADIKLCHIQMVAGHSNKMRSVAFLVCNEFDGYDVYDRLSEKLKRHLSTSFDYWIMNKPMDKRFHGWNRSSFGGAYTNCFVFKLPHKRFYGFLCNPKSRNPRYQLCATDGFAVFRSWTMTRYTPMLIQCSSA